MNALPLIGIVNFGAGNIRSLVNALERLSVPYVVSESEQTLRSADKLILPGVGEARSAMESLYRVGLIPWLRSMEAPFLGICLGMQLLFDHSTERETECLGVLSGRIKRFNGASAKVPHIGWNSVTFSDDSPLFSGVDQREKFYFVHSFYAPVVQETVGTTEHGVVFSSAVAVGRVYGVQFHPEKSGSAGLQVLKNFVERC